ncbi:MAG: glycosyltransferase family 2 protein [Planctomycetota bacterium]
MAESPAKPELGELLPERPRVTAVVPCFNAAEDLRAVLQDLADVQRAAGAELRVIVVDNASEADVSAAEVRSVLGDAGSVLRLAVNTGGSGGFNAGMAEALADGPDLLWLVDADARVTAETLDGLISALRADVGLAGVGPVLCDPLTGEPHEAGGKINRRTGRQQSAAMSADAARAAKAFDADANVLRCDYVAACCMLVRAAVVREHGLMPPIFLNADDAAWCIGLRARSGLAFGCAVDARARHPRFTGFPTGARWYAARNCLEPARALGLGFGARLRCALHEVGRACKLALVGRDDLGRLHVRGLRAQVRGERIGPADADEISFDRFESTDATPNIDSLPDQGLLAATFRALVVGIPARSMVLHAKPERPAWLPAKRVTFITDNGDVLERELTRRSTVGAAVVFAVVGVWLALRAAMQSQPMPLPDAEAVRALAPRVRTAPLSLSIVVLSFNRHAALRETLTRLGDVGAHEIVVVDNASTDGSADMVEREFAAVRLIALDENVAIDGFNQGVRAATGDLVLILDDDARPDPAALAAAVDLLGERGDLGAVTLLPVHPATGVSEWPFGDAQPGPRDDWPVMGCCNLVRRDVWLAVGGYDASLWLYRNDTDLAMLILAAGLGVRFDPAWKCEHDSPAAARKSVRWCELATRNWLWLARRHGRGASGIIGAVLGVLRAHMAAGFRPAAQLATAAGVWRGLRHRPKPIVPGWRRSDGRAFARLVSLQLRARRGR